MNRKELKSVALSHLKDKWVYAILAVLILSAIVGLAGGPSASGMAGNVGGSVFGSLFSLAFFVLSGPIMIGFYKVFVEGGRKGKYDLENILDGFKHSFVERIILGILKTVYLILWTFLFVIPGIVKFFSYRATEFIAIAHPEYSYKKCIDESKRVMNGHKAELFVLYLSFLGWFILSALTAGILYIVYVGPYFYATLAEYMERLLAADPEISKPAVITAEVVK